jgi:hypothetical protein
VTHPSPPSWPGFVPAIHVFLTPQAAKTWMPGTGPGMTNHGKQPMHRFLACMLIAALAGPALAEDQPKSLKTIRIREPAPGSPNLYVIDEDGTVRIDWAAVETLAASKADRTVLPLAQLMLAIRDGTWKPAR